MNTNEKKLKESIGFKRYKHSLRVLETAIKLSKLYNVDINKTRISALYHDCGRIGNFEEILETVKKEGIFLKSDDIKSEGILHSIYGAYLAKHKYNIYDEEIINAIRYHTTGRENMTKLEKIIYISDYIEPYREFKELDKVRNEVNINLNKAIIIAMENTINHLKKSNIHVNIDTLKALEYLKKEERM